VGILFRDYAGVYFEGKGQCFPCVALSSYQLRCSHISDAAERCAGCIGSTAVIAGHGRYSGLVATGAVQRSEAPSEIAAIDFCDAGTSEFMDQTCCMIILRGMKLGDKNSVGT